MDLKNVSVLKAVDWMHMAHWLVIGKAEVDLRVA
jgi:hypothetical protein